ncbi:MAG: DUF3662 and FHA domain-containing protein [Coriobacteriales bacterium]|nr:DUF3662 and FHA domain-containing protein [Coriobacteriales bacterium]
MNVLNIFDQRIENIFIEGAPGERKPFSFKRLAKRTVREMEDETFVIDGIDTAPALYTVLVSEADDELMRHMYIDISNEIAQLIEAQAKKRGYTFVGRPLVRFMIDPSLRPGRFSVFAENIDPRTLARLRDEENAFLGIVQPQQEMFGDVVTPSASPMDAAEPVDPLDLPVSDPLISDGPLMDDPLWPDEDAPVDEPAFEPTPEEPVVAPVPAPAPSPVEDVVAANTCSLQNKQTGQVFRVDTDRVSIGRVSASCGVVLRDPNVSRVHAELSFNGRVWSIRDLNSTNGTLVNGNEISDAVLHDGDVLTVGLTDLEFQAG